MSVVLGQFFGEVEATKDLCTSYQIVATARLGESRGGEVALN